MGNVTNSERWSARERLAFIDGVAFWRGWIRRSDICQRFNVSVPQASADLAEYQRIYPRNLTYDRSGKRYAATPAMKPQGKGSALLEDGVRIFGELLDDSCSDRVAMIDLPRHHAPVSQGRDVIRAALACSPIEIYYYSVNSGTERWRGILPTAFAHDGYRWHTRAWCFETESYRDFVVGRIARTRPWKAPDRKIPPDEDWTTWTEIKFEPHKDLSPVQKEAVSLDFGMSQGVGRLKVRKAMLGYTLFYLGLGVEPRLARRLQRLD